MRYLATLTLAFAISLTGLAPLLAHAQERCLSQHLKDAIQLNQSRLSRYSELTHGESEKVSRRLIRFEKLGLVPAAYIDFKSGLLQEKGISVICEDLASMTTVPEFSNQSSTPADPLSQFHPIDTREIAKSIRDAHIAHGFEGISRVTQEWLQIIHQTPGYHCLLRHFLDSILRTANLAPIQMAQGRKANLFFEPAHLSWQFIDLQLFGLGEIEKIDELAAPIQAQGIPILCQDVPQISPRL
jgi:hypothetical protein